MTREEILEGLYKIKNWKCNGDPETHEIVTEAIKALKQESCEAISGYVPDTNVGNKMQAEHCEDCVSRKSLKHKLQEHHDFLVDAYGGFGNLSQNDKARVDAITNCIAMVVNEPPVKPARKKGKWILTDDDMIYCSECEDSYYPRPIDASWKYCPNCGAKMGSEEECAGLVKP